MNEIHACCRCFLSLLLSIIPLCDYIVICSSILLLTHIRAVPSYQLLSIKLMGTSSLGTYLGVDLLGLDWQFSVASQVKCVTRSEKHWSRTMVLSGGRFCCPKGHLARFGVVFGCHNSEWGMLTASNGLRSGCCKTSSGTEGSPQPSTHTTRSSPAPMVKRINVEKPGYTTVTHNHTHE